MSTSSADTGPVAAARRYIMIGAPVTGVRTPRMLEARMAAAGISAGVDVRHLEPDALALFMRQVRDDPSVDGLMVTMPHKRNVMPFLAKISSTASLIGSVNAVKRLESGELAGAQFDGVALVQALAAAGQGIADARILLAGFGGAGTAIAHAILAHGCGRLAVHDNAIGSQAMTAELERLASGFPRAAQAAAWDGTGEFDILVNATPLGMKEDDPSPFTARQVAAATCVADIVADPAATRLAEMARAQGTDLVTGRAMVAAQIDPIFDWLMTNDVEQRSFDPGQT